MKPNFTNHVSRITIHLFCAVLFALCLSAGTFAQAGSQAATQPVTHAPEDRDQLAMVRLRAVMAEAQNAMRQADEVFKAAKERGTKADAELSSLFETAAAKLPKLAPGRRWLPADDGRGGYVFVEREDPTATTAVTGTPVNPPAKAQETASRDNSSPPVDRKPVSKDSNTKPKGGEHK